MTEKNGASIIQPDASRVELMRVIEEKNILKGENNAFRACFRVTADDTGTEIEIIDYPRLIHLLTGMVVHTGPQ